MNELKLTEQKKLFGQIVGIDAKFFKLDGLI